MSQIVIGKKDIFWSYLGNFFRLAANIILLPFMLHFLSDEDLGLWYVFAGISQFVVLLDFGFAPALSRNISYIWCGAKELKKEDISNEKQEETDFVAFKRVLTTCRYIYFSLSVVSFVLLGTVGTYYILSLDSNNKLILWSWIMYGSGVVLNLYYSYFTSFLRGVGAIAENNIAGVISKAVQIVLSCLLLYNGWGLFGASIAYLVSGIALRSYSVKAFYKYDSIGESLKKVGVIVKIKECWDTFVIIWHNASKEGLIMVSNFLSSQANTLICSSVLGLVTTGSYGISVQLATVICGVSNIPYSVYQPKMMEKILNKDGYGGIKLFAGSIILFIIAYFILSICSILAIPIIIWLKPSFEINYSMMALLLLFMFIDKIYHIFSSYISNSNKLPFTIPFIVSSVFSVVLSYILASVTSMGMWALILAPLITALCYNAWYWPRYVFKQNNISIIVFLKQGSVTVREIMNQYLKFKR